MSPVRRMRSGPHAASVTERLMQAVLPPPCIPDRAGFPSSHAMPGMRHPQMSTGVERAGCLVQVMMTFPSTGSLGGIIADHH